MHRPIDPNEIPEEVARFAEAQVAAGRFATIGEVLLAGKEALEQREPLAVSQEERVAELRDAEQPTLLGEQASQSMSLEAVQRHPRSTIPARRDANRICSSLRWRA